MNLTGDTPFKQTNTNNSTNNNVVSSPTVPNFPLAFDTKHNISCSSQPNSIINGVTENVTVTHFSETRGAMERISVPSDNIFNTEVTSPKLDNNVRAANNLKSSEALEVPQTNANNPFLNMSPTTTAPPQSVIVTTITSTNPFIPTSNYSSPSLAISNPFRDGDNNDNKPSAKVESNALNSHTPIVTKEDEKKIPEKVVSRFTFFIVYRCSDSFIINCLFRLNVSISLFCCIDSSTIYVNLTHLH